MDNHDRIAYKLTSAVMVTIWFLFIHALLLCLKLYNY